MKREMKENREFEEKRSIEQATADRRLQGRRTIDRVRSRQTEGNEEPL